MPTADWHMVWLKHIGHAAARETLVTQTPHMAAIWTDLFESMLACGCHLRWACNGPGIGRDARVAYSGLLGRYMARAYLTEHEGVRVLVPLDVAKRRLVNSPYSIEKEPPSQGLEADWVGLDQAGLVIVEAKGTYDNRKKAWASPNSWPPSLETAIGQVKRTAVFSRRSGVRRQLPAKRWAVASRWGTDAKPRRCPTLVAWSSNENRILLGEDLDLADLLLRADVEELSRGLGHIEAPIERSRDRRCHSGIRIGDIRIERGFAAALGPFGVRALRGEDDMLLVRHALEHETGIVIASVSERYLMAVITGERRAYSEPITTTRGFDGTNSPLEELYGGLVYADHAGLNVAWPRGHETPIEAGWDYPTKEV